MTLYQLIHCGYTVCYTPNYMYMDITVAYMVYCGQPLELCSAIAALSSLTGLAVHGSHGHILFINGRRTFHLQHSRLS